MLQAHPSFPRYLQNANIPCRHGVNKRLDGNTWGNIVGNINNRKRGRRQSGRANRVIGNFQVPLAKAVFAIEPIDQLADQFARKGSFIESPALDSSMNFLCMNIRNAGHCICHPRPNKCVRRCQSAHVREKRAWTWRSVKQTYRNERDYCVSETTTLRFEAQRCTEQYQTTYGIRF